MEQELSVETAKEIASISRLKGRRKLCECLKIYVPDEEDDPRNSILVDYLYDSLMFGVQKGFSWPQVCSVFHIAKELQCQMLGKTKTQAVHVFKELITSYQHQITEDNIKCFTEYFFTTFMAHYNLYQYVFAEEQNQQIAESDLHVETPAEPNPFKESKPYHLWEYEEKIKEIENCEKQKREEKTAEIHEKELQNTKILENTYQTLSQLEVPVEHETLLDIIAQAAKAHVTVASGVIHDNIEQTVQDMDYKLQKNSLPRPQELGPPTKYKTKTPIGGRKSPSKSASRVKSSQSKGRASVKSGKAK